MGGSFVAATEGEGRGSAPSECVPSIRPPSERDGKPTAGSEAMEPSPLPYDKRASRGEGGFEVLPSGAVPPSPPWATAGGVNTGRWTSSGLPGATWGPLPSIRLSPLSEDSAPASTTRPLVAESEMASWGRTNGGQGSPEAEPPCCGPAAAAAGTSGATFPLLFFPPAFFGDLSPPLAATPPSCTFLGVRLST